MAKKKAARGGRMGIAPEQPVGGSPSGSMWERMFGVPTPAARTVAPPKAAAPKAPAPAFVRPAVDPGQYYDVKALFEYVRGVRQDPAWRPPASVPLQQLARPTQDPLQAALEVGRFFKMDPAELSKYGPNAWQYLVEPFVRSVAQAVNLAKPPDLPGSFQFTFANDGSFGFGYVET